MAGCLWGAGSRNGGGGNGAKGKRREQNGGKGDTQRLFHWSAPFSGANMRKMSLDSFFVFLKVENETNSEENVQNAEGLLR
jgi:hypothetical protein